MFTALMVIAAIYVGFLLGNMPAIQRETFAAGWQAASKEAVEHLEERAQVAATVYPQSQLMAGMIRSQAFQQGAEDLRVIGRLVGKNRG